MEYPHKPVMVDEVLRSLITVQGGIYVDGTAGSGGHSEMIAGKISEEGRLICVDRDSEAIRLSRERLGYLGDRITFIKANFTELDEVLRDLGIAGVTGILLDLGMSSYQLEQSGRGFSFNRDEPLDMRMDMSDAVTAQELLNSLPAAGIEKILRDYGEEKKAVSIARLIERVRGNTPIKSSIQLANLVRSVIPPSRHPGAKDPATRTFQALRIAINSEMENLKMFLDKAPSLTERGGRVVFLTYHSIEDRLVKQAMADWEKGCICPPDLPECCCNKKPLFKRIYKKGIRPAEIEIHNNPRARSATLRASERI